MFYFDIQLAHLGIPQYRKRLWCVPVRGDVHDAMGDYPTPQLEEEQMSPQIGAFLLQDESYYRTAAPIQSLIAVTAQVYFDFKPHLVGTVRLEGSEELKVWGELGLSPCVRTSNRILIALGNEIVEITLEGKAALQGIPLHQLPPDREQAQIAVGQAINRSMMKFVMAPAIDYIHRYMIKCMSVRDVKQPTTTATDDLDEEPPNDDNEVNGTATAQIEPTGSTMEIDGPWTAEETGAVKQHLRRQPTNSTERSAPTVATAAMTESSTTPTT
jgi:hypothetical protein